MIDTRNPLRPFAREVVYALTAGESETLDRSAIETVGVPQSVLMENAGRSAAQITQSLFPVSYTHLTLPTILLV